MATASKVQLSTDIVPEYYRKGISEAQAKKASELLQANHDRHHIFFNPMGLHNHIVHHLLAIWSLDASPAVLQKGYDTNLSYQRQQPPLNNQVMKELEDNTKFIGHMGVKDNYHTFLEFFKREMEASSWQKVLQKYVFDGDERADSMLVRMFGMYIDS